MTDPRLVAAVDRAIYCLRDLFQASTPRMRRRSGSAMAGSPRSVAASMRGSAATYHNVPCAALPCRSPIEMSPASPIERRLRPSTPPHLPQREAMAPCGDEDCPPLA